MRWEGKRFLLNLKEKKRENGGGYEENVVTLQTESIFKLQ